MNPAYSVILFTTASGAGYGLLALLGLAGWQHGQATSVAFALLGTGVAWALITVGLLSSTFHLGHPERAWRAFSQWRSSWLSREGVAAVATYPVALLFALVWSGLFAAPSLIAPLGVLTAVMCVITVICTGMIYASLKTIPQWHHALTVPVYLVFALATGASLLALCATFYGRFQVFQVVLAVLALAAAAALKFFYWRSIDGAKPQFSIGQATGLGENVRQWEVPHTNVNFIQKEMGFAVARRHAESLRWTVYAVLAVACAMGVFAVFLSPWFSLPLAGLALAAAVVERWLFFAEAVHVVNLYYGRATA